MLNYVVFCLSRNDNMLLQDTRWQCYKTTGGSATKHQVAVL